MSASTILDPWYLVNRLYQALKALSNSSRRLTEVAISLKARNLTERPCVLYFEMLRKTVLVLELGLFDFIVDIWPSSNVFRSLFWAITYELWNVRLAAMVYDYAASPLASRNMAHHLKFVHILLRHTGYGLSTVNHSLTHKLRRRGTIITSEPSLCSIDKLNTVVLEGISLHDIKNNE